MKFGRAGVASLIKIYPLLMEKTKNKKSLLGKKKLLP
jgi:hypothetical protein